MKIIDPVFLVIISEFFVNLSAGWFGAAIIVPFAVRKPKLKLLTLTANVIIGILFLILSYVVRKVEI